MSQKNILFYFKQPQSNTSESAYTTSKSESVDTTATPSESKTETLETIST